MKKYLLVLLSLLLLCGCASEQLPESTTAFSMVQTTSAQPTTAATLPQIQLPEPEDEEFVRVTDHIPSIVLDIKYATDDNFTGQRIYDFSGGYLRYGTVKKLAQVQQELLNMGLSLKIWDAFRPPQAQYLLWDICPDARYVSNPHKGFSSHSRGNTVDVTIVDAQGKELELPTGFDDFSALADRDYSDCTDTARENAILLEKIMVKHGFKPYSGEWWHYSDETSYEPEEFFVPRDGDVWRADCEEFITLRREASTSADEIMKIPAGEPVTIVSWTGKFAHVMYQNEHGYVLLAYLSSK